MKIPKNSRASDLLLAGIYDGVFLFGFHSINFPLAWTALSLIFVTVWVLYSTNRSRMETPFSPMATLKKKKKKTAGLNDLE